MSNNIPNFAAYEGDPIVYQDEPGVGRMRHTFTGLRSTFPNLAVHYVIGKQILPLRIAIVQQGAGQQDGHMDVNLMTHIHDGIDNITQTLKQVTFDGHDELANATLEQRRQRQQDFIKKANDPTYSVEEMAKALGASFSDALLQPVGTGDPSLNFDWEGKDPDYPQPTPGRFPNSDVRMIIVGLDLITVHMTVMPSASVRRNINAEDNGRLQAMFADLYGLASWAAQRIQPYNPTGTLRSQMDGVWNADGTADPYLNEGDGQRGEQERFAGAQDNSAADASAKPKTFGA